jgi:hypothetical protein
LTSIKYSCSSLRLPLVSLAIHSNSDQAPVVRYCHGHSGEGVPESWQRGPQYLFAEDLVQGPLWVSLTYNQWLAPNNYPHESPAHPFLPWRGVLSFVCDIARLGLD